MTASGLGVELDISESCLLARRVAECARSAAARAQATRTRSQSTKARAQELRNQSRLLINVVQAQRQMQGEESPDLPLPDGPP